jgi:acetyltransferase-like isoleucine patch superfamily enzyme
VKPQPPAVVARGRFGGTVIGTRIDKAWRRAAQRIAVRGNVEIGEGLRLGIGSSIWSAHGLKIGDYCAIGRRSIINVDGTIGHFLMTGSHVQILGRSDHANDAVGVPMLLSEWIGNRPQRPDDVVSIGDDVWLGAGAIILGGLSIGTGAIVAAGSVVVDDIPAFSVAAGTPARVVRQRFDQARAAEHVAGIESMLRALKSGRYRS